MVRIAVTPQRLLLLLLWITSGEWCMTRARAENLRGPMPAKITTCTLRVRKQKHASYGRMSRPTAVGVVQRQQHSTLQQQQQQNSPVLAASTLCVCSSHYTDISTHLCIQHKPRPMPPTLDIFKYCID